MAWRTRHKEKRREESCRFVKEKQMHQHPQDSCDYCKCVLHAFEPAVYLFRAKITSLCSKEKLENEMWTWLLRPMCVIECIANWSKHLCSELKHVYCFFRRHNWTPDCPRTTKFNALVCHCSDFHCWTQMDQVSDEKVDENQECFDLLSWVSIGRWR